MMLVRVIRGSSGVGIVIALSLWGALSYAGTTKHGSTPIGLAHASLTGPSAPAKIGEVELKQTPSVSLVGGSGMALRTTPALSTEISVSGLTLLPYVAAGFGGGYVTERDRVLHTVPSASSLSSSAAAGLRSLLGPQLIPSEVHLGVRVPF
ncbi:MAG TPA: hypothetical protein PLO50_12265 [Nitrospira sp.]|nr:hypothetical protein [Nitrospira sp.]